MAALTAAEGGADVILADEQAEPGGRLLSEAEEVGGKPGMNWVADTVARLKTLGVRIMTRTTVTGAYDGGTYGAIERVGLHRAAAPDLPRECFWRITAGQAVLAAGATERPIAFPQNDRPGIMLASALRSYLHRYGVRTGRRVAIFASNDDAHRTALDLMAAGVKVSAVIDPRPGAEPQGDYRFFRGEVIRTRGRRGLQEATVRTEARDIRIEADCLGLSGGWNPNVHLTCHMGARPIWDAERSMFLPKDGAVPGLLPAGAAAGQFSTTACLAQGAERGAEALAALGRPAPKITPPIGRSRCGQVGADLGRRRPRSGLARLCQ